MPLSFLGLGRTVFIFPKHHSHPQGFAEATPQGSGPSPDRVGEAGWRKLSDLSKVNHWGAQPSSFLSMQLQPWAPWERGWVEDRAERKPDV